GDVRTAPKPNPPTASPVMSPRLSGNHSAAWRSGRCRRSRAEAADDAVAEDEQPELTAVVPERCEDDGVGVDDAAHERDEAWPLLVLQPAADVGADEDHADR